MPMPRDIGVIDLMMAIPNNDTSDYYDFIKPLLMDEESRQQFQMPAEYMFKNLPHCLLYTSPSPRDVEESRMPSSA